MKLQLQTSFNKVWDSQGCGVRKQVSIWSPNLDAKTAFGGLAKRNKMKVCLGQYFNEGFQTPKKSDHHQRMILEVTDMNISGTNHSEIIAHVIDEVMPKPTLYKQIWCQTRGKQKCYAWQAVPPSHNFVALGMLVTNINEPPSLNAMRCVPRRWVKPVSQQAEEIWNDSGTGGRPGSIWAVNDMFLATIIQGHETPTDTYYEFQAHRWTLTMEDLSKENTASAKTLLAPSKGAEPAARTGSIKSSPQGKPTRPTSVGRPPRPGKPVRFVVLLLFCFFWGNHLIDPPLCLLAAIITYLLIVGYCRHPSSALGQVNRIVLTQLSPGYHHGLPLLLMGQNQ